MSKLATSIANLLIGGLTPPPRTIYTVCTYLCTMYGEIHILCLSGKNNIMYGSWYLPVHGTQISTHNVNGPRGGEPSSAN